MILSLSVIGGCCIAKYGSKKRVGMMRINNTLETQTPIAAKIPHGGLSGVGTAEIDIGGCGAAVGAG